jgi:hypothetical protein
VTAPNNVHYSNPAALEIPLHTRIQNVADLTPSVNIDRALIALRRYPVDHGTENAPRQQSILID